MAPSPRNLESGRPPTTWELEEAENKPFGITSFFMTPGKKTSPWTLILIGIVGVALIVIMILHDKIINALEPEADKLRDLKFGWLIPIGILIIMSFPPLFGHEIIQIMCGVVWGTWKGFLIAAAGTLAGEIALWFTFKFLLTKHVQKYEKERLVYACLARVVREGGFLVVLVIRYSAIPPHFSTAIFSTNGVNFFVYLAAAILSLPKQFVTVYLGVTATEENESRKDKIISFAVIALCIVLTLVSAKWTFNKMEQVRSSVIAEKHAKDAQMGLNAEAHGLYHVKNFSVDSQSGLVAPVGAPEDVLYSAGGRGYAGLGEADGRVYYPPPPNYPPPRQS